MTNFAVFDNPLGVDVTAVYSTADYALGYIVRDNAGNEYRFVKASAAITAGQAVYIPATGIANACASLDPVSGIAVSTLALNEYGFVQVRGHVAVAAATTGVTAKGFIAAICNNANKYVDATLDVDEGGAGTAAPGLLAAIGYTTVTEAANVASIYLY